MQLQPIPAEPSTELLPLCSSGPLLAVDTVLKNRVGPNSEILHEEGELHMYQNNLEVKKKKSIYTYPLYHLHFLSDRGNMKGGRYFEDRKTLLDNMVQHWLPL